MIFIYNVFFALLSLMLQIPICMTYFTWPISRQHRCALPFSAVQILHILFGQHCLCCNKFCITKSPNLHFLHHVVTAQLTACGLCVCVELLPTVIVKLLVHCRKLTF